MLNNQNFITVIVPAYNSEKTITKTIESVLNQTFDKFEVIVINDGSIDKTEQEVQKLMKKDSRIRLINQSNKGVSAARNSGIDNSMGEYITFLDSDDTYGNNYLEKMFSEIKKSLADICYCGYNRVDPYKTTKVLTKFTNKNVLKYYILGKVRIHTTGWMMNKDFLVENNLKFYENLNWGEDFQFFCSALSSASKITYVPDYLTNYSDVSSEERLSQFSIDKIDKDYTSVMKVIENNNINNKTIESALLNYRLPALIVYRLLTAIKMNVSDEKIKEYFIKYRNSISKIYLKNGFRSIKLKVAIVKLWIRMSGIN